MKNLVIIGAGGIGLEACWVAQAMNDVEPTWEILGYADDNPDRKGEDYYGLPVLGTSDELLKNNDTTTYFHCGIGNNKQRQRVAERLEAAGLLGATLIHPSVEQAPGVTVGAGSYVGAGSILAPEASVGKHVLINTMVGVGHHSVIGDYAQLCPGVKVNGGCGVDKLAFMGSNASILPNKAIGEGASVGANSFVVRSVGSHFVVMGVPARTVTKPAKS